MSVFTAYLNDNAQTPLDRFVSICYTSMFATNTVKSRTDGAYALVYLTYMIDRRRRDKHGGPSFILLIPACGGEMFSKSTVAQLKMGHVRKTTPLLGVIVILLARLNIVSLCKTSGSAMAEGPRDALVSRNSATTKHPI